MSEDELNKTIDRMTDAARLQKNAYARLLVINTELREKNKDLDSDLKVLRAEMIKKNAHIADLDAEIYRLKKKLPPDQGAKKGPDGVLKLKEVKSDD